VGERISHSETKGREKAKNRLAANTAVISLTYFHATTSCKVEAAQSDPAHIRIDFFRFGRSVLERV
jgi:hypothetical protein